MSAGRPGRSVSGNEGINDVIEAIGDGSFSNGDRELFKPLVDSLMDKHDPYLLLLDFESYIACQNEVSDAFLDADAWTRMAILNVARMGKFSTDRTIKQYSEEIWGIPVEKTSTEKTSSDQRLNPAIRPSALTWR